MSQLSELLRGLGHPHPPIPLPNKSTLNPQPRRLDTYSLASVKDVADIQQLMTELGYLDPPPDGGWGPVSRWALGLLCGYTGNVPVDVNAISLEPPVINALKTAEPLPLDLTRGDLAARIVKFAISKGMFVCRVPKAMNIFYVEGMGPNGALNDNAPNAFRDIRCPIVFDAMGVPSFAGGASAGAPWIATTEPGKYFTDNPVNTGGAFHIDLNVQFKAWQIGIYHVRKALLQRGEISGTRDKTKKFARDPRYPDKGSGFGVHHHDGYNLSHDDLGRSSAGCLVGQSIDDHKRFIGYCEADPRYLVNRSYMFMAAVFSGKELVAHG